MTEINPDMLTKEAERQLAIVDCKNLMGKALYYSVAYLNREMVGLWADRADDLLEQPWGIYDGIEGVKRCYLQDFGDRRDTGKMERLKGVMHLYTCDTPIVIVADDGMTAQGLWMSSGAETWREGREKPQGYWRWGKYAVDFIRENGLWKIWKLHFYPYFMTKYEEPWTMAPAYDYAFFPVTPDRPRETPVYHYDGVAVYPADLPHIPI